MGSIHVEKILRLFLGEWTMMLIGKSTMMNSANLHALQNLHAVNHHLEKRLLQRKLRMKNSKTKAMSKSLMIGSQNQKNSDKLMSSHSASQNRQVQAKMNEHVLLKSTWGREEKEVLRRMIIWQQKKNKDKEKRTLKQVLRREKKLNVRLKKRKRAFSVSRRKLRKKKPKKKNAGRWKRRKDKSNTLCSWD